MGSADHSAQSNPATPRGRRRWTPIALLVALVGILVHLLLFFGVRMPLLDPEGPADEAGFATYREGRDSAQDLYAEQALLLDSKPLFMPTRWNYASDLQEIARLRDETELFHPYPETLRLKELSSFVGLPRAPARTSILEEQLAESELYPLDGLGESAGGESGGAVEAVPVRSGFLTWERPGDGKIGRFELSADRLPESPGELWTPSVFWVVVDPAVGTIPPLRLTSSGIAWWDGQLREYLRSPQFLARLSPGY